MIRQKQASAKGIGYAPQEPGISDIHRLGLVELYYRVPISTAQGPVMRASSDAGKVCGMANISSRWQPHQVKIRVDPIEQNTYRFVTAINLFNVYA